MGAIRGAMVGGLGLVTLYNLTEAGKGVTTLFGLPGKAAQWLVSPAVPLIPDLRKGAPTTDANGNVTGTIPGGDTITQAPDGSVKIGGPNGIPVYPNAEITPSGGSGPTVQLAALEALNPSATSVTA